MFFFVSQKQIVMLYPLLFTYDETLRQIIKYLFFCFVGSFQIVTYFCDCGAEKYHDQNPLNDKPCSLLRVKITTGFDLINRRCVNYYKNYMYMEFCVYYPRFTCIFL